MIFLRRSCVLLILLVSAIDGYSGDTLQVNSFNSFRLINIENLWLSTGNSSGLFFNGSKKLIAFDAETTLKNGDFHRISEGGDIDKYSFNTGSYLSIGDKLFAEGSFAYNNLDEKGARWSGTYDPYRGNPYLLTDSLSGTSWHKENYRLTGQLAYTFSNNLILGCGVNYFVAVAAKQKDPRPENMVTQIEFHPSLILLKNNYNLGFDIGYRNRKEEIQYNTYRSNFTPNYFMFKGLGFYSKEIEDGYYRFQSCREVFAGMQFEKEFEGLQSLSELRFNYTSEGIEDGGSVIAKEDGGDWKTYEVKLNQQLKRINDKNIHVIGGKFNFFNGDGTEYTQTKVKEGDVTRYITISKNLKFTRQTIFGEISYNCLKMLNKNDVDWDINTSITAINNSEKYYYVPEIFTSSYFNIAGNAEIQKNFYFGVMHFAPSINARYSSNISSNVFLSNLTEITNTQRQEIYMQEFDFYTADVLNLGGEIQLGYFPKNIKSIDQMNLCLMFDYWTQMEMQTKSTLVSVKVGFVF